MKNQHPERSTETPRETDFSSSWIFCRPLSQSIGFVPLRFRGDLEEAQKTPCLANLGCFSSPFGKFRTAGNRTDPRKGTGNVQSCSVMLLLPHQGNKAAVLGHGITGEFPRWQKNQCHETSRTRRQVCEQSRSPQAHPPCGWPAAYPMFHRFGSVCSFLLRIIWRKNVYNGHEVHFLLGGT